MRRYDMDWLRVMVFGLLIFYHVGMFFVPWGWHIKNNVIYDWLIWPMLFVNQWRLPILFVISGMGTYYALSKRTGGQFAGERIRRLLIPLAFGMLAIVPPQVYFELLDQGKFNGSYFTYWPSEAFIGIYPAGNLSWHHLWFLPYLLVYSLLLLPVFLYLRAHPDCSFTGWVKRTVSKPLNIYIFIIPLYLLESLLEPFFPTTHALTDDWFTFTNFLVLFFFGFVLITVKDVFWQSVENNRKIYLINGLIGFGLLIGIRLAFSDSVTVHFIEAFFKTFNLWSWILALFGYSAAYLNRNSRALAYSNQAVYPFYILHQTVTIGIGYYLISLEWSLWAKASIMVLGTFGISFLLYEFFIRRITFLRPLFGLRAKPMKMQTFSSGKKKPEQIVNA